MITTVSLAISPPHRYKRKIKNTFPLMRTQNLLTWQLSDITYNNTDDVNHVVHNIPSTNL